MELSPYQFRLKVYPSLILFFSLQVLELFGCCLVYSVLNQFEINVHIQRVDKWLLITAFCGEWYLFNAHLSVFYITWVDRI